MSRCPLGGTRGHGRPGGFKYITPAGSTENTEKKYQCSHDPCPSRPAYGSPGLVTGPCHGLVIVTLASLWTACSANLKSESTPPPPADIVGVRTESVAVTVTIHRWHWHANAPLALAFNPCGDHRLFLEHARSELVTLDSDRRPSQVLRLGRGSSGYT